MLFCCRMIGFIPIPLPLIWRKERRKRQGEMEGGGLSHYVKRQGGGGEWKLTIIKKRGPLIICIHPSRLNPILPVVYWYYSNNLRKKRGRNDRKVSIFSEKKIFSFLTVKAQVIWSLLTSIATVGLDTGVTDCLGLLSVRGFIMLYCR